MDWFFLHFSKSVSSKILRECQLTQIIFGTCRNCTMVYVWTKIRTDRLSFFIFCIFYIVSQQKVKFVFVMKNLKKKGLRKTNGWSRGKIFIERQKMHQKTTFKKACSSPQVGVKFVNEWQFVYLPACDIPLEICIGLVSVLGGPKNNIFIHE